ncbi:Effector protein [Pseudomonas sp. UC 17F4]|uniref:M91 family zinc metallopeptidase n=1 Tax=Pseudomonas sp. UC 17F4 TaxID=1855328 RepID=UPI000888125D|nr:M91 family zinc metallopeptidase [Pseudomonas sp. UC 17F4]SDQ90270.1 Effector protein [Pseudomonas sp. UC 17F4]
MYNLTNPNPTYYLTGRGSGYAHFQYDDDPDPGAVRQVILLHEDSNVTVTSEHFKHSKTSAPHTSQVDIQVRSPAENIEISTLDCNLQAVIGTTRFVLAMNDDQILVLRTQNAGSRIWITEDVHHQVIINAGNGNNHIETGSGDSKIYVGAGNNRIVLGTGLTYIETGSGENRIDGNILLGSAGSEIFYARNLPGDSRFSQPVSPEHAALGNNSIRPQGDSRFQRLVADHLDLLRKTSTGRQLLSALDNRPSITVDEILNHLPSGYEPDMDFDDSFGDHFVAPNGDPGIGDAGGKLHFNPAGPASDDLPLLDFYRCLCNAWNSLTGSVFPGTSMITTRAGKQQEVANSQLQAIGIITSHRPFDFGLSADTPALRTNPAPFTENALRLELGLAPRIHF